MKFYNAKRTLNIELVLKLLFNLVIGFTLQYLEYK